LKKTSRNVKNSFRFRQESPRCGIITTVKDAHVCGGDSYQGCCSTSWRLRGDRVDVQVLTVASQPVFLGAALNGRLFHCGTFSTLPRTNPSRAPKNAFGPQFLEMDITGNSRRNKKGGREPLHGRLSLTTPTAKRRDRRPPILSVGLRQGF